MRYSISTAEKKNVQCITEFRHNSGKTFTMEEWWRWGEYIVESDTLPEESEDLLPINMHGFDEYELVSLDDGCSLDFDQNDIPDDEWVQLMAAYEEHGEYGFEELGYNQWESDVYFHGPINVEPIED